MRNAGDEKDWRGERLSPSSSGADDIPRVGRGVDVARCGFDGGGIFFPAWDAISGKRELRCACYSIELCRGRARRKILSRGARDGTAVGGCCSRLYWRDLRLF